MLVLPRPYLSYTQMQVFKTNKERYKREYFEKSEKLDTKYLRFGKGIAELIENGQHKDLLPDLIVYELREYEIRVKVNSVPVLCYLDDCKDDFSSFRDKKTGKIPWTLQKAQKTEQLLFYAVALRSKHGKMPKTAFIDWIETKDDKEVKTGLHNSSAVQITGKVVSFKRTFDKRELDRFEKEIIKVANEISEYYITWINEQIK